MKIPMYNNIPNETYIKIFMKISKENGIPEEYISIKGYSEDRICLEDNNGKLQVYYAHRNQKNGLKEYDKIDEALIDIADRCTESEEQYEKIIVEYTKKAEQCRYAGTLEVDEKQFERKRLIKNSYDLAMLCLNEAIKAEGSNKKYSGYIMSKNEHKIAKEMYMKRKAGRKKSRQKKGTLINKRIKENA